MSVIDDLTQNIDDLSSALDDLTNSVDTTAQQLSDSIDAHEQSITDLQGTQGQLTFPLSPDTTDLIKSVVGTVATLITGTAVLGSTSPGTANVINAAVAAGSIIMLTRKVSAGTPGTLSYSAGAGSFLIISSSTTDTSTVAYVIFS